MSVDSDLWKIGHTTVKAAQTMSVDSDLWKIGHTTVKAADTLPIFLYIVTLEKTDKQSQTVLLLRFSRIFL